MILKSRLVGYADGLCAIDAAEVVFILKECRDKVTELGRDEVAKLIGEAVLKIVDEHPVND